VLRTVASVQKEFQKLPSLFAAWASGRKLLSEQDNFWKEALR